MKPFRLYGIATIFLMALFGTTMISVAYAAPPPKKSSCLLPAWSTKIETDARFELVLDDEAVLDKETGLVWEKSPVTTRMTWYSAVDHCIGKVVGGRMGWRLGTVEELASLVDPTQTDLALPPGHPFVDVQDYYYTVTTEPGSYTGFNNFAYVVGFRDTIGPSRPPGKTIELYVWCVRGGQGYDGFPIP
jgi:hypothetical protein